MEFVQPITDRTKIDAIKTALQQDGKIRQFVLFTLGINSGLRVSDLLSLRWKDLEGTTVKLREKKTGKAKRFPLNESCLNALAQLDKGAPEAYVFASQSNLRKGQPWTRQYVWQFMNEYARRVGIVDSIGSHSLRKTFGWAVYAKDHDITVVQKLLGHSSPGTTLAYIGITDRQLHDVYIGLNL